MAKPTLKKKLQFWGTGRRKKAIARVRLIPGGSGSVVINDRALEDYFPQGTLQYIVKQPVVLTQTEGAYDIIVNVCGGGYTGQAGAIRHGISRALIQAQPELRPALKKEGFLTRDPRAKERKKYGLKKARRAPQFSKRQFRGRCALIFSEFIRRAVCAADFFAFAAQILRREKGGTWFCFRIQAVSGRRIRRPDTA